jgi:hypothetical protein
MYAGIDTRTDSDDPFYGAETIDGSQVNLPVTLPLISNGSVSIPVWINTGGTIVRYSGNDTIYIGVYIFKKINGYDDVALRMFDYVAFSNGSATMDWSQGTDDTDD